MLGSRCYRPFKRSLGRFQWYSSLPTSPLGAHVEIQGNKYPTDHLTNITPSVISKIPLRLHTQRNHPLSTLRSLIESHYPDFAHLSSFSPLVSPFKNFDQLSFPLDHPGRSATDSYYVNKDLMLRTHTSAHEVEVFEKGETKWLLTADVYRRDEIDASHYPVFHQVEGARLFDASPSAMREVEEDNERLLHHLALSNIVIEDVKHVSETNPVQAGHDPYHAEIVAQNLKLSLNGLILRLFGSAAGATPSEPLRVRWIEAYFPFTSPSFEVEVFFRGKWLEILGCGVVEQATLNTSSTCACLSDRCSLAPEHSFVLRCTKQDWLGVRTRTREDSHDPLLHSRHSLVLVYGRTLPVPV